MAQQEKSNRWHEQLEAKKSPAVQQSKKKLASSQKCNSPYCEKEHKRYQLGIMKAATKMVVCGLRLLSVFESKPCQ